MEIPRGKLERNQNGEGERAGGGYIRLDERQADEKNVTTF